MTSRPLLALACLAIAVPLFAADISSDFPGASDLRTLTRPASSYIIGAMHIDNDEIALPLGPIDRNARKLAKSVTVTGPIDVLAYEGPKSASSLTTFTGLASQLTANGYTQVFSCARATCGDAYQLSGILNQPLVDSIHTGEWAGHIIDDLDASNNDIRIGTFRKGAEYIVIMGVLAAGHNSAALVVRANGPAAEPVLTEAR